MPSVLSKQFYTQLLGPEWSFGYNCYEVGHTWTPNCTDAALEVSTAAGMKILPLYVMLYVFSQVAIQRKYDLNSSLDTLISILRSSGFIFFHTYNGSLLGCAFRRGFGRFYYRVLVCAPALMSSFMSLLIEKPSRRQALAFYLLNLASETVFRMLVDKKHIRPIKNGETLVFATSLAAWYYFIKKHGFGHDPISMIVKILIGRDEAKSRSSSKINQSRTQTEIDFKSVHLHQESRLDDSIVKFHVPITQVLNEYSKKSEHHNMSIFEKVRNFVADFYITKDVKCYVNQRLNFLSFKHKSCPHGDGCLEYILSPVLSRFAIGYAIQSLLKVSSKPLLLIQDPRTALSAAFKSPGSIKFGMFLATLVASGRLVHCCLRYYSNSNDKDWHALVSGFVAGSSMLICPRSSISMYIMWKAVEQYYLQAAREKKVNYFNFTILMIYSLSAATILYTFALEPKYVRPSYMKFLDNISNHRLHQLNRMVLDVFGTGASVGYEDYFPDLDPRFMSNQFKELIFNWMIQPYE